MNRLRSRSAMILIGAVLVGIVALFLLSTNTIQIVPTPTPTPAPRPTDLGAKLVKNRAFPSLSYGIQAFVWWNEMTRSRDLERVRQLRFGYVKQIFEWNNVRAAPNQIDNWLRADIVVGETNYRALKLIARLDKPPYWAIKPKGSNPADPPFDEKAFGQFCFDLATRYKGKIAGYQVWNEPNLAREWDDRPPNPAAYVKLLAACYKGVKAADPDAMVISAPLAPTGNNDPTAMSDEKYLQGMFDAGLSQYYDALGLNAPGFKSPPETPPNDPVLDGQRWQAFRHVEDMRAIQVARGDGAKQVAILEVGWTTDLREKITVNGKLIDNPYRWHAVTEAQQADYLVRAYEYAGQNWRPWVGLMVLIYMPDPTWTQDREEYWWSITSVGNDPHVKEAFLKLSLTARYIDDVTDPAIGPLDNPYKPLPAWVPITPTPTPKP